MWSKVKGSEVMILLKCVYNQWFIVMYLYVCSVRYVVSVLFAAICYFIIIRLTFFKYSFYIWFLVFFFQVLLRVNEQRNILHEIRKRKADWIGQILRRNCLLQQVIEGKIKRQIEATRRRGRRRKKLLDDLKERRGYCQLKEEAVDRTVWRNRFGRGFGPVVWQITDDDDIEWASEVLHADGRTDRQTDITKLSFFAILRTLLTIAIYFVRS